MPFNFYNIIKKVVCFLLIVMCVGLPITGVYGFIILLISGLVIVTGQINCSRKRFIDVFVIAITILLVKGLLPHATIQEGHNIFFTKGSNEVLERQLPPEAFSFMKQQFLNRYDLEETVAPEKTKETKRKTSWLLKPFIFLKKLFMRRQPESSPKITVFLQCKDPTPKSLFAFSADSTFSRPKYSRIVDTINFNSLTEFRGGFTNSDQYNWYGDFVIKRESLPFFVMYELSEASVNSSLCWTGYLLWEEDGHYETIYHQQKGCRKITKSDIGKKVFGVSIYNKGQLGFWARFKEIKSKIGHLFDSKKQMLLTRDNDKNAYLSIHLKLSPLLKFSLIIRKLLEILGVFFILRLMVNLNRKRFITAILIIGIATSIAYLYCPELFGQYYIHEGGEDGLTHDTYGRMILANAISGNWMEALRGEEDFFWNTPGFRYFRALEKLFFGDTNLGYLAVILIFPYILFGFMANFISRKWAFWTTIVFLLGILPFQILDNLGFTYYRYLMVVRGGWPDALAFATFLGALTLLLRYAKARSGAYYWYGFWAHFLLFITVFMRPQFIVSALIIVVYFAFKLIREGRFRELLYSWLGFLPVFFPLWHNYYFGNKLYLFTGTVHLAVDYPPSLYFSAFKELVTFNLAGHDLTKVILHVRAMIGPWYRLVFLGIAFYIAFFRRRVPQQMRMISIVCLSLHFVNLFIFAIHFRYVYLTWGLTVVIAIYLSQSLLKERFRPVGSI
ncbi:hypothetical protein ACFL96_07045 [Thermoproteota archaeon]